MKKFFVFLIPVLMLFLGISLVDSKAEVDDSPLIEKLLSLPAPPPGWQESEIYSSVKFDEKEFYKNCEISAPVDLFMKCWVDRHLGKRPEKSVINRITKNFNDYIPFLDDYLISDLIESNSSVHIQIKEIYERCQKKDCGLGRGKQHWSVQVKKWLMMNSDYFRKELVNKASGIKFEQRYEYIENSEYLEALAKLDWVAARPIIVLALKSNNDLIRVLGLSLQLDHIKDTKSKKFDLVKENLIKIIFNETSLKEARKLAVSSLLAREWQGRDEFYLSLFKTDPYKWLREKYSSRDPLNEYISNDAERWIGKLSKLINHENRNVHNNAVAVLSGFKYSRAKKETLALLIPWLRDSSWSDVGEEGRKGLIDSLQFVKLPESIPALIWVFENESDEALIANAAESLAFQGAQSAIPLLKNKFQRRNPGFVYDQTLIESIMNLGGFDNEEITKSIQDYSNQISTPEGRELLKDSVLGLGKSKVKKSILLGYWISEKAKDKKYIAGRILKSGMVSNELLEIMIQWNEPLVDRVALKRLGEGGIEGSSIISLLNRRKLLKDSQDKLLRELERQGGEAGGIASVLRGNQSAYKSILAGSDAGSQKGLLACARLLRIQLDVDQVLKLLGSEEDLLSEAARQYLISEDSKKARKYIQENSKGRILILGSRMKFDPGHFSNRMFDKLESDLVGGFSKDSDLIEMYAILSEGYWGNYGQVIVLVRKNEVELVNLQGWGRYQKRIISKEEYGGLENFIINNKIDDLPPLTHRISDGIQYEYIHIKKDYGRRVYMNNPKEKNAIYFRLVEKFWALLKSEDFVVGYKAIDVNPNARILPRDDRPKQWGRHLAKYQPLKGKGECKGIRATWQSQLKGQPIIGDLDGVTLCNGQGKRERFLEGIYGNPVVTPDNRWMVIAKVEKSWAHPNHVVTVDLKTKKETKVNLGIADNFDPISYLEFHQKVLLERYQDPVTYSDRKPVGPKNKTYYLLDPANGQIHEVKGEFFPWHQHYVIPLQRSKTRNHVWVARYDIDKNKTEVSLYDQSKFKIRKVQTIKSILFDSSSMWVDEDRGFVYVDTKRWLNNEGGSASHKTGNELLRFSLN